MVLLNLLLILFDFIMSIVTIFWDFCWSLISLQLMLSTTQLFGIAPRPLGLHFSWPFDYFRLLIANFIRCPNAKLLNEAYAKNV